MLLAYSQTSLVGVRDPRVEFMNKFFKGDGYKFDPLSFHNYLENDLEGGN